MAPREESQLRSRPSLVLDALRPRSSSTHLLIVWLNTVGRWWGNAPRGRLGLGIRRPGGFGRWRWRRENNDMLCSSFPLWRRGRGASSDFSLVGSTCCFSKLNSSFANHICTIQRMSK